MCVLKNNIPIFCSHNFISYNLDHKEAKKFHKARPNKASLQAFYKIKEYNTYWGYPYNKRTNFHCNFYNEKNHADLTH